MKHIQLGLALIFLSMACAASASAQPRPEYTACQDNNPAVAIPACSRIVDDPRESAGNQNRALEQRARAYGKSRELDAAIADFDKVIARDPARASAYAGRALAYMQKGLPERVITDTTEALRHRSDDPQTLVLRADAKIQKCDYAGSLADVEAAIKIQPTSIPALSTRAGHHFRNGYLDSAQRDAETILRLQPESHIAFNLRGLAYARKNTLDNALADFDRAIAIKADYAPAYNNRGLVHARQNLMERAYADFDAAVRLAPTVFVHLFNRAKANQHIMRREAAIADFKAAIDIPSRCSDDTASREDAKWRYGAVQAELQQQKQQATSQPTPAPLPKSDQSNDAPTQRRVALVIGNQSYQREKPLRNPANDARAIAAVLRKLGFASVIEANDLSREAMSAAIAKFGRDSATADWAIVFYSGHGLQADRTTYLVPVDAKLVQTSDLSRELVSLDTVLDSLSAAKALRLVILDACRDNPFTERLRRVAQGPEVLVRGLARPSSPAGTLVAFAAREGQVAEDGAGEHSPYTQALLTHIEEPNIQVDHMMRKVRDTVMERTKDRDWRDPRLLGPQEPYTVGSLPNTPLCFRGACPGR